MTPEGIVAPGAVELDGDRIAAVVPARGRVPDRTIVPGFVDLQVNGVDDVDVAVADGADWDRLDELLARQGTTTWCPTLVSAPLDSYAAPLARIAAAAARPGPRPSIAGAHLEGPFLGAMPGAHPLEHIVDVDRRWLAALPQVVAVVTLGPEAPGALGAIRALVRRGTLVALGHSAATFDEAVAAVDAGARLVTHCFNAMPSLHHREPGLVGAALVDDRLAVSLIADGVHVHPAVLRLAFRVKPRGKAVLVTDAVAWRAAHVGAISVRFDGTAPRLPDGTLAGSAVTMDRAVRNLVERCDIDLLDAVWAAATAPAALLGLDDRGRIAPGCRADLVALGPDLEVTATWVGGAPVHGSTS